MRASTSISILLGATLALALPPVAARADEPAPAPAPDADVAAPAPVEPAAPALTAEPAKDEPKKDEPAPAAPVVEPVPDAEPAKAEPAPAPAPVAEPVKTESASAPATAAEPAKDESATQPADTTAAKKKATAAPTPGGLGGDSGSSAFSFDLSIYENSALNTLNYNNSLVAYLEPRFAIGKILLKDTPFKRLTINGRWVVTRTLFGYDPSAVDPQSDLGFAPRCSDIVQKPNGTIDVNSIRRCPTDQSYRTTPGDIWVTIADPRLVEIPKTGIFLSPSVRLVVPVSYESRYQTMRFASGAFFNFGRAFEELNLNVSAVFGFTKYFHASTTPQLDLESPAVGDGLVTSQYRNMQIAPNSSGFYADLSRQGPGRTNPSFATQQFVSVDWSPTDKLAFSVLYMFFHTYSYDSDQCTITVGGQPYDACAAADRVAKTSNGQGISPGRAVNDLQIFWAMAAYQLNPWTSLQLSWSNTAPLRKEDNTWRQGFISTDYNAFTSVSLGATFSLTRIGDAE